MRVDSLRVLKVELGLAPDAPDTLVHPDLLATLEEADTLVGRCGGAIVSRQIVALLIVTWRRINHDLQPIVKK